MATIDMMPKFAEDESQQPAPQEVVQPTEQENVVEEQQPVAETETPSTPSVEEKPISQPADVDTGIAEKYRAIQALQEERAKLLRDIADLRGQRRELKQDQINRVEQQLDELKDVAPEDVAVIEKVLRGKGYVPKQEVEKMFYDTVKNEELNKFLDKYPEYKPENDKNDLNWSSLQKELGFYRMPDNPRLLGEILQRAHQAIAAIRVPSDRGIPERKRQVELAQMGSGGAPRSSSHSVSLDSSKREMLLRGGFTEEDVQSMEKKLS